MGKMHYGKPVQNPGEPEIVREWRERHPDAERPIFDDAVKIAGKTLDEGYLGSDQASPSDWRFSFATWKMGEITRYAAGGSLQPIARPTIGIP